MRGVEPETVLPRHLASSSWNDRGTARTGDASAPMSLSGSAIRLVIPGRDLVQDEVLENAHVVRQQLLMAVQRLAVGRIDRLRINAHQPHAGSVASHAIVYGANAEKSAGTRPLGRVRAGANQDARRKASRRLGQVRACNQRPAIDRVDDAAAPEVRDRGRDLPNRGRATAVVQWRVGMSTAPGAAAW